MTDAEKIRTWIRDQESYMRDEGVPHPLAEALAALEAVLDLLKRRAEYHDGAEDYAMLGAIISKLEDK